MKRHEAFQHEQPMVFKNIVKEKKTSISKSRVRVNGELHIVASSVIFQKNTRYINSDKTSHTLQGFDKNPH